MGIYARKVLNVIDKLKRFFSARQPQETAGISFAAFLLLLLAPCSGKNLLACMHDETFLIRRAKHKLCAISEN